MKRIYASLLLSALLLAASPTLVSASAGVSLLEAINQSAAKMAEGLPKGSRVAVVAWKSESENLSDYIMEELTGALVERGIEVADRQNLEYVYRELKLQNLSNSEEMDEKDAQSVGKFLAAELVITGQLVDVGGSYRFLSSATSVEKATRASVTRFSVSGGAETQKMAAAFAGKTATVKSKYSVSEDKTPQTAGTFIDRGILFASKGEYDKAIADFTEALKINPKLGAAYALRGKALVASVSRITGAQNFEEYTVAAMLGEQATQMQIQIYDRAIDDYTQAIQLDPQVDDNYVGRGTVYMSKGDYDMALADFNQTIKINPDNNAAYNNRGHVYFAKGDYNRALADYNQAIKISPDIDIIYISRGNVYFFIKKDYDLAIADYNQAIKNNPELDMAYCSRGRVYVVKGDLDRALADYNQAIKINPNSDIAHNGRGLAYAFKGDINQAMSNFEQAIKINPNYSEAYIGRGNVYYAESEFDKAIADYGQAIKIKPDFVEAYFHRGLTYYTKGDFDLAIADYGEAIKINPGYVPAYNFRGIVYNIKGDLDKAIADYEMVLRIDPNHANAKELLEQARQKQREQPEPAKIDNTVPITQPTETVVKKDTEPVVKKDDDKSVKETVAQIEKKEIKPIPTPIPKPKKKATYGVRGAGSYMIANEGPANAGSSYSLGIASNFPISSGFSLQMEMNYQGRTFNGETQLMQTENVDFTINDVALQIPIMLRVTHRIGFYLEGGFQADVLLGSRIKIDIPDSKPVKFTGRDSVSPQFTAGAGFIFEAGPTWCIGYRYAHPTFDETSRLPYFEWALSLSIMF